MPSNCTFGQQSLKYLEKFCFDFMHQFCFLVLLCFIPTTLCINPRERIKSRPIEDAVMKLPTKRPLTPVIGNSERVLKPHRVIPSETPCIYKKYISFFRQAEDLKVDALDLLAATTISLFNQDYYLFDPEDLCIVVEDDLVIDIYRYDCSQAEVCTCGVFYGYVDPNIPQPDPINQMRKYMAVNGLDRKLVDLDGECVSGELGHCTLRNSTAIEKLHCSYNLDCVLDDSYGPILQNKQTLEVYGICLPKPERVPAGDNMIAYEKLTNSTATVSLTVLSKFLILICYPGSYFVMSI